MADGWARKASADGILALDKTDADIVLEERDVSPDSADTQYYWWLGEQRIVVCVYEDWLGEIALYVMDEAAAAKDVCDLMETFRIACYTELGQALLTTHGGFAKEALDAGGRN